MKASEAKLLDFLKKSPQFIIPIFQRTYSWQENQCEQLWNDILRAGKDDKIGAHFIGSVVYIQQDLYHVTIQSPLLVIDGQQRLTTASLIIEALSRHLGDTEPVIGFSAKKLRNYYLLNPEEEGERGFKLLLTQTDKDSLLSLLRQKPWPAQPSLRIQANFEYFNDKISNLKDLTPLCQGLAKLMIVDIALTRGQDNPQLIFESMNSTGRALTQADLIRNFILMGLEQSHQSRLYEDHWRPMELEFGQAGYRDHFDSFMRHYLTVRTGQIPRLDEVYEAFKVFARKKEQVDAGVDQLVADIHKFGSYFCAMAFKKESDPVLSLAFQDLLELRVDVAFPFLLELYDDYAEGLLSRDEFAICVHLTESYVFRRGVCAIPTNSLNKTFATFGKALKKDRYLESVQAHFLTLPSYRRFPDNVEFKKEFMQRDLYNTRMRSYWLRRLENYGRKERVAVQDYTIEHILPQNENLSIKWREALGPDWKQVQKEFLHTLGNLTLTGYNSEYSDRPFEEKRDMDGGFKHSPLRLNEGLGAQTEWNQHTILARSDRLSDQALNVWAIPVVPESVLSHYRSEPISDSDYTLSDHPHLAEGTGPRALFDAIRKEVLALDPGVTEDILKLYIAFKAETNFVDIVPQKNRLRLALNMPFLELRDPKGIAKDVTGIGRWGNGDVEVGLNSIDEIPYIMGLIRQSFERQMGSLDGDS